MNDIVSIVVPVYNSEKYLSDTINVLLMQTYQYIEIILVDDGSQDGASEICDNFAKKDNRIKVIHQNNGGICAARNTGLKEASGKYLMFCDDDDKYELNTVELAHTAIVNSNSDIVKYRVKYIKQTPTENIDMGEYGIEHNTVINIRDCNIDVYSSIKRSKSLVFIWNCIYNLEVINCHDLSFNSEYKYGGEDFDFNMQFLSVSPNITFIDNVLYTHYKRAIHSTSAKFNLNQLEAVHLNLSRELSFLGCSDLPRYHYAVSRAIIGYSSILSNPKCSFSIKQIAREYEELETKYLETNIGYDKTLITKVCTNKKARVFCWLFSHKFYYSLGLLTYFLRGFNHHLCLNYSLERRYRQATLCCLF